MKKCYTIAVLALLFLCIGKIGWAQGGYIQFVDSLESYLSRSSTHIEVEDLVFSNLQNLRVRRLINEDDEHYLFQRGYDLNKDSVLNENDGFEILDQEKFTPWSAYLEMFPCHENQSVYLEVRGIDSMQQVQVIKKMLKLRDPFNPLMICNHNLKIPLPPDQTTVLLQPNDIIRGKVFDQCVGQASQDTIGLNTVTKFTIEPWDGAYYSFKPSFDPAKRSMILDCRENLKTVVIARTWSDVGQTIGCIAFVELVDSTGICQVSPAPIRFKDSLNYHLFKSFTALTPLLTAQQVIKPEPEQSKARSYSIRRSINKNSIAQWIQLGYDRNGDGVLSNLDGYDWNQDGDITDLGEYFETKGSFLISPYMDTLPLVCSDFGDSLWIEIQASYAPNVSRYESKWLSLPDLPTYFGDVAPFYSSFIQLKPGEEPTGKDKGIGIVHVSDFIKSPFYTCLEQNENTDKWGRNRLNRVSIARSQQLPDSTRKTLTHQCCEGRSSIIIALLHLWDEVSNKPIAEFGAPIEIRDTSNACFIFGCSGEPPSLGTIVQGTINTWQGQPLKNYQVLADAYKTSFDPYAHITDEGSFSHYARYMENINYTYYIPEKDDDHTNGVSTFDLLKIQQHILGKQTFTSPYQFIAADINRSGSISTLDVIQLRKLILNIDSGFSQNSSWRFVDAAHVFEQPEDAISKYLPDRVLVKVPASTTRQIDFIAIKIGDLNGSAILK